MKFVFLAAFATFKAMKFGLGTVLLWYGASLEGEKSMLVCVAECCVMAGGESGETRLAGLSIYGLV